MDPVVAQIIDVLEPPTATIGDFGQGNASPGQNRVGGILELPVPYPVARPSYVVLIKMGVLPWQATSGVDMDASEVAG